MSDIYCKYYQQAEYESFPKCSLEECELDICPMVYRCQEQHKWRPLKDMEICYLVDKHERNEIMKNGKNVVRFVKSGQLYVELYDKDGNVEMVVTIPNPYDYEPKEVEVVKVKDDYFVKGFEPKEEKKLVRKGTISDKKIIKK